MKKSVIKSLIISSLDPEADTSDHVSKLESEGLSYKFGENFETRIMQKISSEAVVINRELEFVKSMNYAFKRIALTGAAAIILLLLSIFLSEGSLSIESFLGMANGADETILCVLTGN
jgi:hypothetical protein